MFKNLKKKSEGFTIIEVLIVLAIAGLILLIVFLAVPALQRNSRNTQRRNDVQKMLGVLQESANNNNGVAPAGAVTPGIIANEKYGQYVGSDINYNMITSGVATLPGNVQLTQVIMRNNLKCSGNTTTGANQAPTTIGNTASNIATTVGATYRTYVAIFSVELQGGQVQSQCVDS
jgi:prepilin-type N-terminal cleavage/methylation domain-containing protein